MSTNYPIIIIPREKTTFGIENSLNIYEHSNLFNITIDDGELVSIDDLSTDELFQAALKILQVCSYFMDTDELKERVNQFIKENIY